MGGAPVQPCVNPVPEQAPINAPVRQQAPINARTMKLKAPKQGALNGIFRKFAEKHDNQPMIAMANVPAAAMEYCGATVTPDNIKLFTNTINRYKFLTKDDFVRFMYAVENNMLDAVDLLFVVTDSDFSGTLGKNEVLQFAQEDPGKFGLGFMLKVAKFITQPGQQLSLAQYRQVALQISAQISAGEMSMTATGPIKVPKPQQESAKTAQPQKQGATQPAANQPPAEPVKNASGFTSPIARRAQLVFDKFKQESGFSLDSLPAALELYFKAAQSPDAAVQLFKDELGVQDTLSLPQFTHIIYVIESGVSGYGSFAPEVPFVLADKDFDGLVSKSDVQELMRTCSDALKGALSHIPLGAEKLDIAGFNKASMAILVKHARGVEMLNTSGFKVLSAFAVQIFFRKKAELTADQYRKAMSMLFEGKDILTNSPFIGLVELLGIVDNANFEQLSHLLYILMNATNPFDQLFLMADEDHDGVVTKADLIAVAENVAQPKPVTTVVSQLRPGGPELVSALAQLEHDPSTEPLSFFVYEALTIFLMACRGKIGAALTPEQLQVPVKAPLFSESAILAVKEIAEGEDKSGMNLQTFAAAYEMARSAQVTEQMSAMLGAMGGAE